MIIVSSRDFRANQCKYFNLAKDNDVVIKSRIHGSYKLVPVSENDLIIDDASLQAKIDRGIEEYSEGKGIKMKDGEKMRDFLQRLINED
ncbi:MAG: prevent-host-death protein [Bacteroidales bacterium]